MNVYKFNAHTGEYIGEEAAFLDPLESKAQGKDVFLLPANATYAEPPDEKEGFVRVWDGTAWTNIEDHRGEEYWLLDDTCGKPARKMTEIGPFPKGAVNVPPEPTAEELAEQKAQQEAYEAQVTLNTIQTKATRMMLAGGNIAAAQSEYQVALMSISDDAALKMPDYFPTWDGDGHQYSVGDRVMYNDVLYKVLQSHTSQSTWTPTDAPSLFAKVLTSTTGEPLPWEQPDSTNPYMIGDRVTYNRKVYESTVDNNVWAPDAYPQGWKEVTE